ncbi:unnamed protein product [Clonostachys rosea f. rosea IK726]|uniref:Uncharacterized protein n=1 Tax=Clonostachys rosea f. rosea IK726 TaxID=1349383 RepID=A0ACA9UIF6_BIOOC|nr:unnamed protein product [Clonostachys rosea f. rosea IK726]
MGLFTQSIVSSKIAIWGFTIIGVLFLFQLVSATLWKNNLPPSPKGYPLVGNLPEIVKAGGLFYKTMTRWAQEHGEVMRLVLGPNSEYIINSDRACQAVFTANSAATSERPFWHVGQKYFTNYQSMDLLDASNPRWKLQRKVTLQNLTSVQRLDNLFPFLYHETLKFIHEVAVDPDAGTEKQTQLFESLGRYVYSTFTSQLFGLEIPKTKSKASEYIWASGIDEITTTISGVYLADIFTWLDYLPLGLKPWAKKGITRFNADVDFVESRMAHAKELFDRGEAADSFLTRIFSDMDKAGITPSDGAYFALKLVIAASDTSRISSWVFLEQMVMNPEIQAKARKIIDEAVGDRLPVWEDVERIPYVRYLMKETWRMRPPVGNGLGHRTKIDIKYNGYVIPANSTIRPNIWAIGRDPERHPNPDVFKPERWEGDVSTSQESGNYADNTKRDHFAFGVGRRFCPGVQVADRSFAVAIMRFLWSFDMSIRPGVKLPINPDDYMEPFLPGIPGSRFPLSLKVRENRKDLIIKAWEAEIPNWKLKGSMDYGL